jgi:ubiquinone/menaquinone biosynthesis C-methylase UbiE
MAPPSDEEKVAELWDLNADLWTCQVRAGQDLFREVFNIPMFLDFLPDLSGLDVLDAGCGEGRNTRLFARRGATMTAVDISPRLLQAAQDEENREPLGIRYSLSSFTNLSGFADASFDAVVSTMALMDGPDFSQAAREMHRVLRKGGGLYFSVTHPCFVPRGSGWLRDESGAETARIVSNYWDDQPYVEQWGFAAGPDQTDFTILYFPYRLEDYINTLCRVGFSISRIAEPRPSEAIAAQHPRIAPFRRHVPLFLYIAATK